MNKPPIPSHPSLLMSTCLPLLIYTRHFMNTDKRAQRLVKSLAKRMKTEVG